MFDGNRFLPLTGMPIWKMARNSTLLAVWLPEPLTVATWMLKSLTTGFMVRDDGTERHWGGSSKQACANMRASRAVSTPTRRRNARRPS